MAGYEANLKVITKGDYYTAGRLVEVVLDSIEREV